MQQYEQAMSSQSVESMSGWRYQPTGSPVPQALPPPPIRIQAPSHVHEAHKLTPLKRELNKIEVFMIGISAVIGIGFYVKTGLILRIGGTATIVYAFFFVGVLTLMVMYSLSTMLRIWPIAGSLIVFVETFVDEEVGKTVAILYWFTWSFVFAGLTTAIGNLLKMNGDVGIGLELFVTIISLVIPLILNLMSIRVFGWVESVCGTLKLVLALCIIIMMNIINTQIWEYPNDCGRDSYRSQARDAIFHQEGTKGGWFSTFVVSSLLVSFCFVGIEAVATTAQEVAFRPASTDADIEARPNNTNLEGQDHQLNSVENELSPTSTRSDSLDEAGRRNPFQYIMWIPLIAAIVYIWGGWIVSQDVKWDDESLPTLSFNSSSNSIFVKAAQEYCPYSDTMPTTLIILLIINTILTSSTALYVASRHLFGFAYATARAHESENAAKTWWLTMMRALTKKTKVGVPYRAVFISGWLFWLPFLQYVPQTAFVSANTIITEMASVSGVIVWGFESLAAYRFYKCYSYHGPQKTNGVPDRIKSIIRISPNRWYYFHLATTGLATFFCAFLVIFGGALMFVRNTDGHLHGIVTFSVIGAAIFLTYIFKWFNRVNTRSLSWLKFGSDLGNQAEVTRLFKSIERHMSYND